MLTYEKAKPLKGESLNYEVVGGTSTPTTFNKENTIWVKTDMVIGEYQFAYTQPTTRVNGSILQNGDIWFQTDIDKAPVSFNAVRNNELIVYPFKCKQWDGNTWKSVNSSLISDNGNADNIISTAETFIVENGAETMSCTAQRYTADVTRTLNNGYVTITATNGAWEGTLVPGDGCYRLTDKLDLTNIDKITMTVTSGTSNDYGYANFYVTQKRADMYSSYASSSYCPKIVKITGPGEYTLDVSSLSGEYWVGLQIRCLGSYSGMSTSFSISNWKYE